MGVVTHICWVTGKCLYLAGYIAIPRKTTALLVKMSGELILKRQLSVSVTRLLVNQKPTDTQ